MWVWDTGYEYNTPHAEMENNRVSAEERNSKERPFKEWDFKNVPRSV